MKQIRYVKKMDGHIFVVESVGDNKYKKIWLSSAYMQKSPAIKQSKEVAQARHATKAFGETSETVAASPSNTMVAQQDGVVNSYLPCKSNN